MPRIDRIQLRSTSKLIVSKKSS